MVSRTNKKSQMQKKKKKKYVYVRAVVNITLQILNLLRMKKMEMLLAKRMLFSEMWTIKIYN